jgi:hypothetical protein
MQELAALEIASGGSKKSTKSIRSVTPCSKMVTGQIRWTNTNAVITARNRTLNRAFSSSSASVKDMDQDDLNKARFVRFFAAIFMLTAGIRVAPNAAASTVDHTVKLLDAEERMLVSAGLSRLNMLLGMDAVKRRAVECGALPRLLGLINTAVVENSEEINAGGEGQNDIGTVSDRYEYMFIRWYEMLKRCILSYVLQSWLVEQCKHSWR